MYTGQALSASRCKTFESCTFKYFLTYELYICPKCKLVTYVSELQKLNISLEDKKCPTCQVELIQPMMGENWAAKFGNLIHYVMESYAKTFLSGMPQEHKDWKKLLVDVFSSQNKEIGKINYNIAKACDYSEVSPVCQTCQFAQNGFCSITKEPLTYLSGCPLNILKQAEKICNSYIKKYKKRLQTDLIGVEEEFILDIGSGVSVLGYKDLVLECKKTKVLEIIDYKTGKYTQNYEKLKNDLQAQIYSLAAKAKYPGYDAYLLTFDYIQGNPVTITFTQEEDNINKNNLIKIFNKIKNTTQISRRPYDYVCKYMCDRTACDFYWDILKNRKVGDNDICQD